MPEGLFAVKRLFPEHAPTVDLFEEHILRSWDGWKNQTLSPSISSQYPRFLSMYFDSYISQEYSVESLGVPEGLSIWDTMKAPPVLVQGNVTLKIRFQ